MVNSMVERATSDMLIGPDWATNIEICDMLNRDPGQAKDVVKGIKRRLGSRNPKVQLLSLTLLETIIKNCGDIVHMHVAERDILHEMVKIVKKKPDFHVKEKILILIDTWQEAFGGRTGRYSQYYGAFQDLTRAGVVFPPRSERSSSAPPVFTPPQTQPLASYPPNLQVHGYAAESGEADYPSLSLTEVGNARDILDVLSQMLNAVDPASKEGVQQEVITDLVEQCRTYKQRVVHLVNSTSEESLLLQGLALNDDLQRVLAKHEAMASGIHKPLLLQVGDADSSVKQQQQQLPPPPPPPPLVSVAPPLPLVDVIVPPPVQVLGRRRDVNVDLLSGDDYGGTLALVPVTAAAPPPPVVASEQNAMVLLDTYPSQTEIPLPPPPRSSYETLPLPPPQRSSYDSMPPQPPQRSSYEGLPPLQRSSYETPSPLPQQRSPYEALPPPPWEGQQPNGFVQVGWQQQGMGYYPPQHAPSSSSMYHHPTLYGADPAASGYSRRPPSSSGPEDKLFGDLVHMARISKPSPKAPRN